MSTPIADLDDFTALDPFFRIIAQGLRGFDPVAVFNVHGRPAAH
jgi:hypothetical protein